MIIALVLAVAASVASAPPASTDAGRAALIAKANPVTEPVWLALPKASLMKNCTTGYLTEPSFAGETIYMACIVQKDGSLNQCKVRESTRAQAAGVQDVAICASEGFRIGPVDKKGQTTAGRPMLLPLAIVAGTTVPAAATPAKPTPKP